MAGDTLGEVSRVKTMNLFIVFILRVFGSH